MSPSPTLNERAQRQADFMIANAASLRISVAPMENGAKIVDCGIAAKGGIQAGLGLARVCFAGLAEVTMSTGEVAGITSPILQVSSDNPVLACMASQYAGWQIKVGKYFAMGSGPMRAAWGKEKIFSHIPGAEKPPVAVGVLETDKLPTPEAIAYLENELGLPANKITLLCAPAASIAGNMQVVARSLETSLHKLHELGFSLDKIIAGSGCAPVPPVGKNMLHAIGRTNDAILYGGRVVLWVDADDEEISEVGAKLPASASPDYGAPFAEIFARCNMDFYKIDPLLFSPAEVVFHNVATGRGFCFGRTRPEVLWKSFFSE